MSSGEADAAYARRQLASARSLDAFTKCSVAGCAVNVHLSAPAPVRCRFHGGPKVAQYETSATDGSFLWTGYMTTSIDAGGDCE